MSAAGYDAASGRVHRNTVYRCCRTGKLRAVKLGKEWRVLEDELEGTLRGHADQPALPPARTGDSTLDGLLGRDGHVVGVVGEPSEVFELELVYLKAGLARNRRLLKACWWQSAAEVTTVPGALGRIIDVISHHTALYLAGGGRAVALTSPSGAS